MARLLLGEAWAWGRRRPTTGAQVRARGQRAKDWLVVEEITQLDMALWADLACVAERRREVPAAGRLPVAGRGLRRQGPVRRHALAVADDQRGVRPPGLGGVELLQPRLGLLQRGTPPRRPAATSQS